MANQLRMARKNFTETIWSYWVQAARERFSQASLDVPEGIWARGWALFEAGRESVEQERAYLLAHRVHDEFWYARYFALDWPQVDSGTPTKPRLTDNTTSQTPAIYRSSRRLSVSQPFARKQELADPFLFLATASPSPPPPFFVQQQLHQQSLVV